MPPFPSGLRPVFVCHAGDIPGDFGFGAHFRHQLIMTSPLLHGSACTTNLSHLWDLLLKSVLYACKCECNCGACADPLRLGEDATSLAWCVPERLLHPCLASNQS